MKVPPGQNEHLKYPSSKRGSSGIGLIARWQIRWVQSPVFALLAKIASRAVPESATFGVFGNTPSAGVPSVTIDLEPALKTMHQLGLDDGDIGYRYWYDVARLLESAAVMKARIDDLEAEVAILRGAHMEPPSNGRRRR